MAGGFHASSERKGRQSPGLKVRCRGAGGECMMAPVQAIPRGLGIKPRTFSRIKVSGL